MKNSLINPNQVRAFGVSLCDDPTDPNRHMGMTIQDQLIPFAMAGSTCHFTTRMPTNWEMENCLQVEITSDAEWNLNQVHFLQDPGDHEDSLESSFVASYDTRHRRLDVEPSYLAKQWGIGLETATKTLKATTQAGIHHAIHPLSRHYRTDHMTLRHQRLLDTFYFDTLFSGIKSLHSNKCMQVTTNGSLIHVFPMTSKSEAGDALSRFVQDIGIPDVVVVDGAGKKWARTPILFRHVVVSRSSNDRQSPTPQGKTGLKLQLVKSRSSGETRCTPRESQNGCGIMD